MLLKISGSGPWRLTSDYKTLGEQIPLPCIAHWRQRHYVVFYEATATKVVVADPGHGLITYSPQDFLKGWIPEKNANEDSEGILLLFETIPAFFHRRDIRFLQN